jgi:G3E family GTPase
MRFDADGIVTVLDRTTAGSVLAARADTVRQAAMADVIALSRGPVGAAIDEELRFLNPVAARLDAATAAPAAFTGHGAFDPAFGDPEAWLDGAQPVAEALELAGEAARVRLFTAILSRTMPFAALDRFVEYLAVLQAPNLIRVRGLVSTGENEAVVVEAIGACFSPPLIVDRPGAPSIRFSIVARDLEQATFEGYLDAFLGEARIDTPDARALTENPLAVAGFSARSGR